MNLEVKCSLYGIAKVLVLGIFNVNNKITINNKLNMRVKSGMVLSDIE